MERRLLLDVVVREGSAILKLLSGEDQSLLVWRNTFFVLDLSLDIFDGVSWLNIKSDGFTSQSLDEDLHTTSKSENQVEGRFLLDVVIRESSAILKLLSGKDKSLLVWWDSFLVLDLGFHVFNGVSWFNIESDSFSSQSFDEDLHTTSKSENQMEGRLLLDVVV